MVGGVLRVGRRIVRSEIEHVSFTIFGPPLATEHPCSQPLSGLGSSDFSLPRTYPARDVNVFSSQTIRHFFLGFSNFSLGYNETCCAAAERKIERKRCGSDQPLLNFYLIKPSQLKYEFIQERIRKLAERLRFDIRFAVV